MRKFQADFVCPVASEPIAGGVVITEDDGTILHCGPPDGTTERDAEHLHGTLVPGFINTHCHLELSHMQGMADTGTGLISFITTIVGKRDAPQDVISEAIRRAENQMLEGGIVAVGDISNVTDTFAQKSIGRLRYYTFVEMFDFLQEVQAEPFFEKYKDVFDRLELSNGHHKSCVPHSPYSVSRKLFHRLYQYNEGAQNTISIHNQEMPAENALFLNKSGGLPDFYAKFNMNLDTFEPTGRTSIYYALENMDPAHRTLFVHNTLTTREEIRAAQAWSKNVYWATCPNANLYIENRLPDYSAFLDTGARMTIGTDSLASNWQLSILEEMKTIARFQSYVPFETLLRWATLHGAQALGFDDTLGSIEQGKRPGLVLLDFNAAHTPLHAGVSALRFV